MSEVCIIDTGTSNIKSIVNAITHLNFKNKVIKKEKEINEARCIILPGVGSFDKVMQSIKKNNLADPIRRAVLENEIPILGICIGMQVLFSHSEEGKEKGLDFLRGKIKKLPYISQSSYKVPNTGFREVIFSNSNPLITKDIQKSPLYFNHSYGLLSEKFNYIHDKSIHNNQIVASFNYKNIFGMQFHPEKSQEFGLYLLKNFIELNLGIFR